MEKIIYIDEAGFEPNTQRDYGWAYKGEIVRGFRSGHKRPRTTIIGALSGKNYSLHFISWDYKYKDIQYVAKRIIVASS